MVGWLRWGAVLQDFGISWSEVTEGVGVGSVKRAKEEWG